MKTLYNEGRVVGLSAYELYVKTMLSRNPMASILSESQWLAASLSTNNSMILKVAKNTLPGYHDYMLPEGSDLCGCTCMFASVFEGEVVTDENDMWATSVDDYGRLISNNGEIHPRTPGMPEDVPVKIDYREIPETFLRQSREYMKISTGLMLQPGSWTDNVFYETLLLPNGEALLTPDNQEILAPLANEDAKMTLRVDLSKRGFIRLLFDEEIEEDFYIFFHGLSYKNILAGMSGFDNLLNTDDPENGDFLGPQSFPWAVHIIFLYTNDMLSTVRQNVARMEELYEQVVEQTTYFERTAQDLNDKYDTLYRRYDELVRQFGEVTSAFTALQEQVGYFFTENNLTMTDILNSIDTVDGRVTTTNDRITDDEAIIDTLSGDVARIDTSVDSALGRMDTVESTVADFASILDQTAEDLNTRIDVVDGKIGNLDDLHTVPEAGKTIVAAIGNMSKLLPSIKTPAVNPVLVDTINKVYSTCKNN